MSIETIEIKAFRGMMKYEMGRLPNYSEIPINSNIRIMEKINNDHWIGFIF